MKREWCLVFYFCKIEKKNNETNLVGTCLCCDNLVVVLHAADRRGFQDFKPVVLEARTRRHGGKGKRMYCSPTGLLRMLTPRYCVLWRTSVSAHASVFAAVCPSVGFTHCITCTLLARTVTLTGGQFCFWCLFVLYNV